MGLLFIKTVPPPPCAPGKAAFSELARASSFSAPQPAAQPTGGQRRWWWRPYANQGATKNGDPSWMSSETCFLDTWDKGGPHGAYPLPLSEKGVSLLLLQTSLISGIPHLPVWLPPQVASMPPQEEAPTSKVLLLLLHGRARPGGRLSLLLFSSFLLRLLLGEHVLLSHQATLLLCRRLLLLVELMGTVLLSYCRRPFASTVLLSHCRRLIASHVWLLHCNSFFVIMFCSCMKLSSFRSSLALSNRKQ